MHFLTCMPHTVYTYVWIHWQMKDRVVQALEPWKIAPDFSIPIWKISEMAGERGFLPSFLFFFFFFLSFFCCCCCSFELFLPGNVHEIQELKCFSALIMLIIQHSRGLRRKDPWNVLLNLILISSLSFSLLSYENQSMKHLFCFSFYSLMSSVVEPIGLGLDMVSGLMHHMQ